MYNLYIYEKKEKEKQEKEKDRIKQEKSLHKRQGTYHHPLIINDYL